MSGPEQKRSRPGEKAAPKINSDAVDSLSVTRPQTLSEYLNHFRQRVVQDALSEATSGYWRRRARQFEAARPRPGEYQFKASAEEVAARDIGLLQTALACNRHAGLIDSLRPEPISETVTAALGEVA